MTQASNAFEAGFLNFYFNNTTFTPFTGTIHMGWHELQPPEDATSNEIQINTGGRGATLVFNDAPSPGARQCDNSGPDPWTLNADTGLTNQAINWVSFWNSPTFGVGSMACYASLGGTSFSISDGEQIRVNVGAMIIQFAIAALEAGSDFNNATVEAWLTHVFGSTPDTPPTAWEIGLADADPGIGTSPNVGSEFDNVGYSRQAVTGWTPPAAGLGNGQQVSQDDALAWTNLNSADTDQQIHSWMAFATTPSARYLGKREHPSPSTVSVGANANANPNSLILGVD